MKKLITRSLFACLLISTSAPALHAEQDPMLVIGPETDLLVQTAAEQCNALGVEYQQAVFDTLAQISQLTGRKKVSIVGTPMQIMPRLAERLDLLGRPELAEQVRLHINEIEAARHRVCIVA